jgi:hypothetical protein
MVAAARWAAVQKVAAAVPSRDVFPDCIGTKERKEQKDSYIRNPSFPTPFGNAIVRAILLLPSVILACRRMMHSPKLARS